MGQQGRSVDRLIGQIAFNSHGVLTRGDLLRAGVSAKEIRTRLDRGTLVAVHRGVYRVGHRAPSLEATYMAAVRACGDGAVLSGLAASHLLGLTRRKKAPSPEVTSRKWRRVDGVKTRRSSTLGPGDKTNFLGIPVTSAARTLVDLAAELSLDALARACHEAGIKHRTTPAQVTAVLERRPNARGAANLRRVLYGDARVSLSRLESKFLCRLREVRLPLPQTNRPAGGRRVDCRWPEHRLTVELDSYRYHSSRYAWEQDRRREREAYARGDEFRRYTPLDVFQSPQLMVIELRGLLHD